MIELTVSDDGAGFDPGQDFGEGHRGLRNMEARASALGGHVSVESIPEGGTRVQACVPATAEAINER